MRWGRVALLAQLSVLLGGPIAAVGCDAGVEPDSELDGYAEGSGGKQDGFDALSLRAGERVELSVVAHRGGSIGPEHAKALRVDPGGAPGFAVVMRAVRGEGFDPYLRLYAERDPIASSKYEQGVLPMAGPRDAVVAAAANAGTGWLVIAADLELEVDATFEVAVVALPAEPSFDVTLSSPGALAYAEALRGQEPVLAAARSAGTLVELEDGLVQPRRPEGVSLADWAKVRAVAEQINDLRSRLYQVVADETGADPGHVAQVLSALWSGLR